MHVSVRYFRFGNPNGYSLRTAQGFDSRQYFAGMVYKKGYSRLLWKNIERGHGYCHALRGIACPDPRSDRDALIAATALTHKMSVVTRNCKDFEPMGVPIINPWTC